MRLPRSDSSKASVRGLAVSLLKIRLHADFKHQVLHGQNLKTMFYAALHGRQTIIPRLHTRRLPLRRSAAGFHISKCQTPSQPSREALRFRQSFDIDISPFTSLI